MLRNLLLGGYQIFPVIGMILPSRIYLFLALFVLAGLIAAHGFEDNYDYIITTMEKTLLERTG